MLSGRSLGFVVRERETVSWHWAPLLCGAYAARRGLVPLYGLIAAVTVFGSMTVWTKPDLLMPM